MEQVLEMLVDERKREIQLRGSLSDAPIIGGMQTVPILDGSERLGYKVVNIVTKEEAIAERVQQSITSRETEHRVVMTDSVYVVYMYSKRSVE